MSRRFVVDFRIASTEHTERRSSVWHWPVPQSAYDHPLNELVTWGYSLPSELSHDEQLRTAYELVEIDIFKDLTAALGAWIDVDASQKQQLDLIHGPDQTFYQMFKEDQFFEYSLMEQLRSERNKTIRSKIGRFTRRIRGSAGFFNLDSTQYSISTNTLTNQILPSGAPVLRISHDQVLQNREISSASFKRTRDLAHTISDEVNLVLSSRDQNLTANGKNFITQLIKNHLAIGIADQSFELPVQKSSDFHHLYTGSGGIYHSRLASFLITREGGKVTRSTHGGDTVLFNDPFWVGSEMAFTSNYVTFGTTAADTIAKTIKSHHRTYGYPIAPKVSAAGSTYHRGLLNAAASTNESDKRSNIVVVSASFTGELRAIPHVKIHDVVYLEWHGRLLRTIKGAGFNTISKRHPKGMYSSKPLFSRLCDIELTEVGMANIGTEIDAFVLDIAGSAFMEAMCSLKPVVLIDIPTRRMTDLGRARIAESAQIVEAKFDDHNRVIVNDDQLIDAIRKPFDANARKRFIEDYLLLPYPEFTL